MRRFDEIELDSVPLGGVVEPGVIDLGMDSSDSDEAPRVRRLMALMTDVSLFTAISLALRPLLRDASSMASTIALAGFIVVISYYYFTGCWLLWGKTVGGAIFDVGIVATNPPVSLRQASLRWLGLILALLTGGLALLPAMLPSRRSLPDYLSGTRCVRS